MGADGPLARLGQRYAGYLPAVAVLGVLASVLEGIGVGLLIPLLALLLADTVPAGLPAPVREVFELTHGMGIPARILLLSAAILALIVLKGMLQAANAMLIAWINGALGRDLQTALSARLLKLEYGFFLRHDSTRLVHIISTDSWFVSEVVHAMLSIGPALLSLAVFSVFLAWLDWRLFLIVAAGAIAIRGALMLSEARLRRLGEEVTESNFALGERMMAVVLAMRNVRVFGQEAREERRFSASAERVRRALLASRQTSATIAPAVDVLTSLLFVIVLVAGYWLGTAISAIAAFLVLLARALPHARTISEGRMQVASLRASVHEVEWLLSQDPEPAAATGRTAPAQIDRAIRFEGVSYRYPDPRSGAALEDVSAVIRPNVATALIGASGSGKTTLINLLCRLVEPESGAVLHGDTPLADIDPGAWRARIAIAGQDIALLDGTLAENIAYGMPGAERSEIELAAQVAGASAFIADLPDGYETRLGLHSISLSGGQRQRIGLARALVRRPDLLILDEAINAVDSISETEIIRLLGEHRHFRTALVVSHRKSALASCEDCIVLGNGRVLETGPLAQSAYYRAMN